MPVWVHKSQYRRERELERERDREGQGMKETPTFGCWGLSCVRLCTMSLGVGGKKQEEAG